MFNIKKFGSGALLSPEDNRDYKINQLIAGAGSPGFDLPATYINPLAKDIKVLDQGMSSMCVACSLVYLRWLCEYTQSNNRKEFSPAFIYGNRDPFGYNGEGMMLREALSSLKKSGTCFYDQFPGFYDVETAKTLFNQQKEDLLIKAKPYRISSYYRVDGIDNIKAGVYKLGGVMIAAPMLECLYYPSDEHKVEYNPAKHIKSDGNHAMTIIGWTETHWIVLNSWGKEWGDNGIAYIPFNYPIAEAWAVVDEIMEVIFKMAKFKDTEGHWAENAIEKAANKGIVKGYEDGSFHPDEYITRGQLLAILDRLGLLD